MKRGIRFFSFYVFLMLITILSMPSLLQSQSVQKSETTIAEIQQDAFIIDLVYPTESKHIVNLFSDLLSDTLRIKVAVNSNDGQFISGLQKENFQVAIGVNQATVLILQEMFDHYYLSIQPPSVAQPGFYPVSVTAAYNNQSLSDSEANAILYTEDLLVEKGLAWLKSEQNITSLQRAIVQDEMGGSERPALRKSTGTTVDELGSWNYSGNPNAGITALALQSFLAQGYTIESSGFGPTIERAIRYLLETQSTEGYHAGAIYNYSAGYESAMAVVALKSALKSGLSDPIRTDVENALQSALAYYTADVDESWNRVSWRYDRSYISEDNGDMSANQWAYLALNAMEYTQKDIWQKIFNYIQTWRRTEADKAWIGYYRGGTRERGNTLAAIWGLILANNYGVKNTIELADSMYNYIGDGGNLTDVICPDWLDNYVYSGGGYYYYVYEFAKAMALGGKSKFIGEDWYNLLYNKIKIQHQQDEMRNYYWTTGWTAPDGYTIASSHLGDHGSTAMAVLSMQTGTVPEDSRFVIRLIPGSVDGSPYTPPANALNGLYLNLYDTEGRFAGPDNSGSFMTDIPLSSWVTDNHFQIDLLSASAFSIELHNGNVNDLAYDLYLEAYQGDNPNPVSSKHFSGIVKGKQVFGTSASVNAIGGLTVYAPKPFIFAQMTIEPERVQIANPINDSTYTFNLIVYETGDSTNLLSVDVFATEMADQFGNTIPSSAFQFVPNSIVAIPAGGSQNITGYFTAPPQSTVDFTTSGLFEGLITVQSSSQTRAIPVTTGVMATGGGAQISNHYFYPNPINFSQGMGTIHFELSASGNITVKLYDAASDLVTTLMDSQFQMGGQQVELSWNGLNDQGDLVANGVYFYVIEPENGDKAIGKIAVLK
ncbi:hypothetical protein GF407_06830 [candidate division KSB1 bacterium]|nr:hypothetical protein [candidate division KSB1 bacterium]